MPLSNNGGKKGPGRPWGSKSSNKKDQKGKADSSAGSMRSLSGKKSQCRPESNAAQLGLLRRVRADVSCKTKEMKSRAKRPLEPAAPTQAAESTTASSTGPAEKGAR